MFKEFMKTVAGLVSNGKWDLLQEYFEIIDKILKRPIRHPRLNLIAVVKPKEL